MESDSPNETFTPEYRKELEEAFELARLYVEKGLKEFMKLLEERKKQRQKNSPE